MANELDNPWEPKNIRNSDAVGAVERCDRYTYDLTKFESAIQNVITEFDMARIQSYISALRAYVNTLNSAPATDNPFSYPGMYRIEYLTENIDIDAEAKNKALRDIIRMLVQTWVNMSRSESADRSNGFEVFDVTR